MLNLVFFLMLGLFLVGTPVLLYAGWIDEYFGIIKQTHPRHPQFANWLIKAQWRHGRPVLALVR